MSAGCISHVHLGRSLEETSVQGEDRSKIKLGRCGPNHLSCPFLAGPADFFSTEVSLDTCRALWSADAVLREMLAKRGKEEDPQHSSFNEEMLRHL